ncbi:unnamed protein product, partial [Prorocentrum cordatum]
CSLEGNGGAHSTARGDPGTSLVLAAGGGADGLEKNDTFERQVRRLEGANGQQPAQKSCAGVSANNKSLYALMMTMLLSLVQSRRNIEGVLFDVLIVTSDLPEVLKMQALQLRQQRIGKQNFDKLQEFKQHLATLGYDETMDIIRFTKVDKCYDQGKRRITLCIGEYRKEVIGALQQLGAELKSGRAPASHMERELQECLE